MGDPVLKARADANNARHALLKATAYMNEMRLNAKAAELDAELAAVDYRFAFRAMVAARTARRRELNKAAGISKARSKARKGAASKKGGRSR